MSSKLMRIPKQYPFVFGTIFAGAKNGLADVIVQTQVEGKSIERVERKRTALFTAFGAVFCGVWQVGRYHSPRSSRERERARS